MAFVIDGTTGIATVDGSVSAPSQRGQDSNSGISYAADTIKFSTNGVERMAITNSGVTGTGIGDGKVLQVVQTVLTSAVSQTSSNTDYAAISGFTRSITPSSSSNKVLVSVKVGCASATTGDGIAFRLYKDGSEVTGARGSAGSTYGHCAFLHYNKDHQLMLYGGGFDFLDSPSTTSSITYQMYWASTTSGSNTRYINRRASSTGFTMISSITLYEVDPT